MIVSVDLGTSGVRVALVDRDLDLHDAIRTGITVAFESDGRATVVLAHVLTAVFTGIRSLLERNEGVEVDAVSFSSQGEVIFPLTPQGSAPESFAVTVDTSGVPSQDEMAEAGDAADFQATTGQPLHAMFPVFRLHGRHRAGESFGRVVSLDSHIRQLLGGGPQIDLSLASRSGMFDVDARQWSPELCSWAGLGAHLLPPVVPAGSVVGAVDQDGHGLTGLPVGTPIVVGSHDQACAYWGAGGIPAEVAVFSAGSSECLTQGRWGRPDVFGSAMPTYPVAEDLWLTLVGIPAGGWALEWLAKLGSRPVGSLVSEAAARQVTRVLVHPYFGGSPTFRNDPSASASMHRLSLDVDLVDLTRAMVEASGFELGDGLARTEASLGRPARVHCSGTGASFDATSIRADACTRTLTIVPPDAAIQGAALQAWVGLGAFESLVGCHTPPVLATVEPARCDLLADKRREYLAH